MSGRGSKIGNLGEGAVFPPGDYASFLTRILILTVDGTVLLLPLVLLLASLFYLLAASMVSEDAASQLFYRGFILWMEFAIAYLTILEKSSWGTLGMAITSTRIVTLRGESPSFLRMVFRLGLWILGPIHPLWDLLWVTGDECRQTLRDKLAGTYVVRKRAAPIGWGRIRYRHLFVFGMNLPHLEVDRKPMRDTTGH